MPPIKINISDILGKQSAGSSTNASTNTSMPAKTTSIKITAPVSGGAKKPEFKFQLRGAGITQKAADKATRIERVAEDLSRAVEQNKTTGKFTLNTLLAKQKQKRDVEQLVHERPETVLQLHKPLDSNIKFDDSQLAAIHGILSEQFSCLIGAAGTGKSTVLEAIAEQLTAEMKLIDLRYTQSNANMEGAPEYGVPICFCAFTGRAVDVMRSKLDVRYQKQCATIHATLGYAPEWYDDIDDKGNYQQKMRFVPTFGEFKKLPYKVYVIDESGMLPIDLWNNLRAAMLPDARVIMVGDINQLPPVIGRSALGFAMTRWPTFELTTIHRQKMEDGSESVHPIIAASQKILHGSWPVKAPGVFDMYMVPPSAGSNTVAQIIYSLATKMTNMGEFDCMRDIMIVSTNDHEALGQNPLNEKFVTFFNPPKREDGVLLNPRINIRTGKETVSLAIGDKVMLLQNDRERGLTNGMIGVVTNITVNANFDGQRAGADFHDLGNMQSFELDLADLAGIDSMKHEKDEKEDNQRQASHVLEVTFQNGMTVAFSTVGQYKKIRHSYVVTCHKVQGGEYHTVIILCHSANSKMLSREWLYTAVTRGAKRVIVVANERGMQLALGRQNIKGKTIAEKAAAFNALSKLQDTDVPNLPEPKKV